MSGSFRFVPLFLLAVISSPSLAEEPVPTAAPVNVYRPYLPGQTYDINFKIDHTLTSSGGRIDRDPTSHSTAFHYGLTGRVSDAELDAAGNIKGFRIAIGHLTSEGRDSIRPGTLCLVEYQDNKVLVSQVDGRQMPDNARPILKKFFPGFDLMHPRLNAAIGSREPRKTGDSWSIDSKAAAEFLADEDMVLASNVTGTCTLKEAPSGSSGMRLESRITVNDYHPATAPTEAMLERSQLTISQSLLIPGDATQPLREYESTTDSDTLYSTARGGIKVAVKIHENLKQTVAPAGAGAVAAANPATRPG